MGVENNLQLLRNLVSSKVTRMFLLKVFGTEHPTIAQKTDDSAKREFHSIFYSPLRSGEIENTVK